MRSEARERLAQAQTEWAWKVPVWAGTVISKINLQLIVLAAIGSSGYHETKQVSFLISNSRGLS